MRSPLPVVLSLAVLCAGCPAGEGEEAPAPPSGEGGSSAGAGERSGESGGDATPGAEDAVLAALEELVKAQRGYSRREGDYGTLAQLGEEGEISSDLAAGEVEGYRVELRSEPRDTSSFPGKPGWWVAVARPPEGEAGPWFGANVYGVWRCAGELVPDERGDMPAEATPLEAGRVAMTGMMTIARAQADYHGRHGRYASFEELLDQVQSRGGSGVIGPALLDGPRWGYRYRVQVSSTRPATRYFALAQPLEGVAGEVLFSNHRAAGPLILDEVPQVDPDVCLLPLEPPSDPEEAAYRTLRAVWKAQSAYREAHDGLGTLEALLEEDLLNAEVFARGDAYRYRLLIKDAYEYAITAVPADGGEGRSFLASAAQIVFVDPQAGSYEAYADLPEDLFSAPGVEVFEAPFDWRTAR